MLSIMEDLILFFCESNCPHLPNRAYENVFCKYLNAENLEFMYREIGGMKDGQEIKL